MPTSQYSIQPIMLSFNICPLITIAVWAMIQPTFAGPAAAIAGRVGTAVLSNIASGGSGGSNGKSQKREVTEDQINTLFKPCYDSSEKNPPIIDYKTADKSGDITNLDEECMHAFEVYIGEIDPQEFGHATVNITGANSIHVNDIPPHFLEELERKFGKPVAVPVASTALVATSAS